MQNNLKNKIVLWISLSVLVVCLCTLYVLTDYEDKCNTHWLEQMKKCKCECLEEQPVMFNKTWLEDFPIESSNKNKNT